eukprot:965208-Pyramimonas_sp.AAC.1
MPAHSARSQHKLKYKIASLAPCSCRHANWKGPNAPTRSKRGMNKSPRGRSTTLESWEVNWSPL